MKNLVESKATLAPPSIHLFIYFKWPTFFPFWPEDNRPNFGNFIL